MSKEIIPQKDWEKELEVMSLDHDASYKVKNLGLFDIPQLKSFIRSEKELSYKEGTKAPKNFTAIEAVMIENYEREKKRAISFVRKELLEEIVDLIEDGGSPETVLEITHNGEKPDFAPKEEEK